MCKQIYYFFSTINPIFLTLLFKTQYVIACMDRMIIVKLRNYPMKREI